MIPEKDLVVDGFEVRNPVIAMLFNQRTKRWHPLLLKETPFRDFMSDPIRLRSIWHHPDGFQRRLDAEAYVRGMLLDPDSPESYVGHECFEDDIPWPGAELPTVVCILDLSGDHPALLFHDPALRTA